MPGRFDPCYFPLALSRGSMTNDGFGPLEWKAAYPSKPRDCAIDHPLESRIMLYFSIHNLVTYSPAGHWILMATTMPKK